MKCARVASTNQLADTHHNETQLLLCVLQKVTN